MILNSNVYVLIKAIISIPVALVINAKMMYCRVDGRLFRKKRKYVTQPTSLKKCTCAV